DVLDNRSPSYAGDLGVSANPALAERGRAADLLVAVGRRLGATTPAGSHRPPRAGAGGRGPPARAWSPSIPAWPSWAGSTSPTWPSTRPWARSWPPGARSRRAGGRARRAGPRLPGTNTWAGS